MSTTPPAPGSPAPASTRRSSSLVVSIVAIALGAVVVLGTVVGVAIPAVLGARATAPFSAAASTAGVERVVVDASATRLDVRFADVAEAALEVERTPGPWTLVREGSTLRVASPSIWFPGWLFRRGDAATLTLPRSLERAGIDATIGVGAGDVRVDGGFRALGVDLGAGRVELTGSARSLDLQVSAGDASIDLAVSDSLDVRVSAGRVDGVVTGAGPARTEVGVSAGDVDLRLPDTVYAVRSDVSAGSFDNELRVGTSSRTVYVAVSAGSARLSS